ncbi:major facilitator superfamily protein [Scytonema sp. HK-05]|uniref:MFS transporter n=1 Tax=Scytonema sp. HK-05 TaxID=1137095 RepID=UPI000937840C|nr:MFS transporter [Scytonema sp. HK-05]OKH57643.1 MFS transporter [Scytonema sp. HK-05]BAY44535.1 major facilitator superfamily protein [Scytonema sp. HK-05]
MDSISLEMTASEITQITVSQTAPSPTSKLSPRLSKDGIRTSLKASTVDAVFATFMNITCSGILLSNFLVELDASPVVFGMLSSIAMIVNLIQPLGAYLSERTTSRFRYSLLTNGTSRLLWLLLVIGIAALSLGRINSHQVVMLVLVIVLLTNLTAAFDSSSWLSWMATLVPRRLRGRYFGLRNSLASLTNLVCVPLAGLAVSKWPGGTLQGYGVVLFVGVISGMISLGCQYFQVDVNPQEQNAAAMKSSAQKAVSDDANNAATAEDSIWKNSNFLKFLLYFSSWMFAANLSLPFFNMYMLGTLNLEVSWVTFYGSLQAGANLLMLIIWGRLADKIGNRPILLVIGMVAASVPVLWLAIGANLIDSWDLWLWLPLIHIFIGGNWAALDLCNNNLHIEVTPVKNKSIYFATTAAVGGVSGALGTTIGGFVAENPSFGGLAGLFAVSAVFRLAALVPLMFVQEPGRQSFTQMVQSLSIFRRKVVES